MFIRFFLLFIFLYFLFKIVKYIFRVFFNGVKGPTISRDSKPSHESKYKDVEEAKFVEIKEDKPPQKDKSGSDDSK